MGHLITGDLPSYPAWRAIVNLLHDEALTAPALARLTTKAADDRLVELRGDRSLTYCFWLLTRLASASRGDAFVEDLRQLGIAVRPTDSTLQFIARVADRARVELNGFPESGPFGEMASLALRQALMETVGTQRRSLLGSSVEDLADAFRRHTTASQFGELSQRFFGSFMARTLRFYVERALMQSVGAGKLATVSEASDFSAALDLHARAAARIVEDFAAAWYSKKHWEREGYIGRDDAQAFTAHALTKLRGELKRGAVA